ncbi:hypothetical protein [Nitrobacter hamburgensis]|uniref:hypothetical protein n=1 Tax=Nitrobacter hamburgensis TaxID=912 RepID=UPI0012ED097D|nr:hypothetical protein [Nitrobacter hamburgensis]
MTAPSDGDLCDEYLANRAVPHMRQNAELQHTQTTDAKPKAPKAMFIAKIVGVIPKGMSLTVAPSETREFATQSEAVDWLLGEALSSLPTPVNSVEVLSPDGKSVWREWHWSHDALKTKNEKWWNERDPGRAKREKELSERRRKIASGEISGNELSDAERFQRDNPAWTGPYFAYIPTRTVDRGWIWFSQYWERPHIGLKYASKNWFLD